MYNYYVAIILHQITYCIYYHFYLFKTIRNHHPIITINGWYVYHSQSWVVNMALF